MMWGCMSWEGVEYAAKIDRRMDSDLYCSILKAELLDSIKYFKKRCKDILQQDNDPKHISKKVTSWFKDHKIQVMDWPTQSLMKLQLKRCSNREENSVGDEASCSLPKVYLYILWSICVHKPLRGD